MFAESWFSNFLVCLHIQEINCWARVDNQLACSVIDFQVWQLGISFLCYQQNLNCVARYHNCTPCRSMWNGIRGVFRSGQLLVVGLYRLLWQILFSTSNTFNADDLASGNNDKSFLSQYILLCVVIRCHNCRFFSHFKPEPIFFSEQIFFSL